LWGALVIGGVYMTRAIRNVLHGPLAEKWSSLTDAGHVWRKLPYALLLASLFIFGVWPRLLTEKINHDVEKIVAQIPPAKSCPVGKVAAVENSGVRN
jgi:NADH:ubiquinone oxidoreductase subunit 4 (subunit M)